MSEGLFDFKDIKSFNNINIGEQDNFDFILNNPNEPSVSNQYIIIYGANGSGKSSISNALKKLAAQENSKSKIDGRETVSLTCDTTQPLQDLRKRIEPHSVHVFNQEYIDKKVRVSEEDLEAIVMLGVEAEDKERIERIEGLYNRVQDRIQGKEEKFATIDGKLIDKIKEIEKNYYVKANKRRKSRDEKILRDIYDNELKEFAPASEPYDLDAEETKLDHLLSELEERRKLKGTDLIKFKTKKLEKIPVDYEKLEMIVKGPKLPPREEEIVNLIKYHKRYTSWLRDSKAITLKLEGICPLCFSDIETARTIERLEKLLDPASEELVQTVTTKLENIHLLEKRNMESISHNAKAREYKDIYPNIPKIMDVIEKEKEITLEREINNIKMLMKDKIDNVFADFDSSLFKRHVTNYNNGIKRINSLTEKIENALEKHNKRVISAEKEIERQINIINREIVTYTKHHAHKDYKSRERINGHIHFLKGISEKLNDKKEDIKSKFRDLMEVKKEINKSLRFIFFDPDRMKVEIVQKEKDIPGYKVLINNRAVPQKKLSTGEQNILALIYFYHELYKGAEIESQNKSPKFVVLDDPLTSLDENNIVGLISYINWRNKIILENPKSRVVLFTHRWYVFDSLARLANKVTKFELTRENDITKQEYIGNKGHVRGYTEFLQSIFDYIKNPNEDKKSFIGNTVRKTFEAFSTFHYNSGFDTVIQSPDIKKAVLDRFRDDRYEDFYTNFQLYASSLILNTESHQRDNMRNLGREFDEFYFTKDELVRVCKYWIGFLYMHNKKHLFKHLVTVGDQKQREKKSYEKEQLIKSWIMEHSLVRS